MPTQARHKVPRELYFRPDSPLWCTFYGYPGWGEEGQRQILPIYDLIDTPYCCSGAEPPYEHFVRRGNPSDRVFDYVGHCQDVEGPHVHPGSWHGHL